MSSLPDWNLKPQQWLLAKNEEARQLLDHPLLQKDIWQTIEDLGLRVNEHHKILTISFQRVEQDWLKLLVKLYVLMRSQRKLSPAYIKDDISNLARFSQFIQQKCIFSYENINNLLFEEYEHYLQSLKLSPRSIALQYTTLMNFFNLCRIEEWLDVDTHWFKGKSKISTHKNKDIEYIPEEVWQQLDEHLHHLPEPIQRMIIIIRSTGLRIGELLNLPLDCLRKRNEQWRLRFLTEKYLVEDEIPICPDLVIIIQEQQEFIRQGFGDIYHKLFGSNDGNYIYKPAPRVMSISTFNGWLNRLAQEYNIKTTEERIWHFKSHQFRKTFTTVMSNAGIRDLIIQKYLRHRSPDMQNHYKQLLKQMLGDEYQELMKETKYVGSMGKIVATYQPKNPITELVRRRMHQISTLYGECHRSTLKEKCQTVNACGRCEHWRTSIEDLLYLKQDLARIEAELEIAIHLGMIRQQQGLAEDREGLMRRIEGLEANND
ncbi:tyrosine-type recombinase/integrase [Chroococcus sp. FPU101]|uniref:tyrosine-type recombinase/integrase n=1 Tax=Chroococcus sp. FPU101 TaxID=1974212 RepID=UPI001A9008A1|nr:tyrosine-type recombinase/integrase [Chroococcus sp. FPU101]GFE72265.1 hypothetical protein CFPU101_48750 [Chroococcus sp. FPU101]